MKAPLSVLVAGGGTAGHIEPALAVAQHLVEADPETVITALGTARGLETTLIPERGVDLRLIPAAPLPRKVSKDLLSLPVRLRAAVAATRKVMAERKVDVVVGFGGYVALPAYLAARGRVPSVVHEANAKPGLANKLGARWAAAVATASTVTRLPRAELVGIPVRTELAALDRPARRAAAAAHFGLPADGATLLVFGGSQGAQRINAAVAGAIDDLLDRGISVLHAYGAKNAAPAPVADRPRARYVPVPYLKQMELAYAAADLVLARSGALSVAEIGAVGLPALYVPLPHGNGEQRLNADGQIASGSARIIDDVDLDAAVLRDQVGTLLTGTGTAELALMCAAARGAHTDAGRRMVELIYQAVGR